MGTDVVLPQLSPEVAGTEEANLVSYLLGPPPQGAGGGGAARYRNRGQAARRPRWLIVTK